MRALFALPFATLLTTSLAYPQPPENQAVVVGPWTIATTYKADKFDNCTMSRSAAELGISFVWTKDGAKVPPRMRSNQKLVLSSKVPYAPSPTMLSWAYPAETVKLDLIKFAQGQSGDLRALTRGKRLVVLVGQKKAVAIAVRNVSGRRRWSKLKEWLVV